MLRVKKPKDVEAGDTRRKMADEDRQLNRKKRQAPDHTQVLLLSARNVNIHPSFISKCSNKYLPLIWYLSLIII